MTDKKDESEKKRKDLENSVTPSAKDAFDAVADFASDVTRELKGYTEYFGKGTFMKDAASYVRKHGKDRLKTGAATAAKVGAATWKTGPLLKVTLPAAFAAGAIGGPKASKYIADQMDKLAEKMPKFGGDDGKSGDEKAEEAKPPTPKDP